MGERADGVSDDDKRQQPEEIEKEIEQVRNKLTGLVREIDRRRHDFFNWKLQLQKHGRLVLIVGAGALAVTTGLIALSIYRGRQRRRPSAKLDRIRRAFVRIGDDPELINQAGPTRKILTAAGTTLATTVVGLLVKRSLDKLVPVPPKKPPKYPSTHGENRRVRPHPV